ncbi:MAG: hypothetical protein ACK4OK_05430 [Thermoflexus sp.]
MRSRTWRDLGILIGLLAAACQGGPFGAAPPTATFPPTRTPRPTATPLNPAGYHKPFRFISQIPFTFDRL